MQSGVAMEAEGRNLHRLNSNNNPRQMTSRSGIFPNDQSYSKSAGNSSNGGSLRQVSLGINYVAELGN